MSARANSPRAGLSVTHGAHVGVRYVLPSASYWIDVSGVPYLVMVLLQKEHWKGNIEACVLCS